ncbi:MAG: sigma-70 family RNA polymerase sigma factor [Chitinophagales bacterium]|nr:sigma-70 family RNA polymerase sigma factor [Chitinophagales bacterium]
MSDLKNIKQLSDPDLIALYKESGNNIIVGELFQRYTHLVFGVCMKYLRHEEDSRDATLEIFEKLLEDLKKHEVNNFKAWLHSVARNFCLMKLRKGKNHVELKDDFGEVVESAMLLHQIHEPDREEKLNELEDAISHLCNEQRNCVELFYLKEQSYQQIMEQTGLSFKEVKSFIQNGKRNLKITLTEQYERKAE